MATMQDYYAAQMQRLAQGLRPMSATEWDQYARSQGLDPKIETVPTPPANLGAGGTTTGSTPGTVGGQAGGTTGGTTNSNGPVNPLDPDPSVHKPKDVSYYDTYANSDDATNPGYVWSPTAGNLHLPFWSSQDGTPVAPGSGPPQSKYGDPSKGPGYEQVIHSQRFAEAVEALDKTFELDKMYYSEANRPQAQNAEGFHTDPRYSDPAFRVATWLRDGDLTGSSGQPENAWNAGAAIGDPVEMMYHLGLWQRPTSGPYAKPQSGLPDVAPNTLFTSPEYRMSVLKARSNSAWVQDHPQEAAVALEPFRSDASKLPPGTHGNNIDLQQYFKDHPNPPDQTAIQQYQAGSSGQPTKATYVQQAAPSDGIRDSVRGLLPGVSPTGDFVSHQGGTPSGTPLVPGTIPTNIKYPQVGPDGTIIQYLSNGITRATSADSATPDGAALPQGWSYDPNSGRVDTGYGVTYGVNSDGSINYNDSQGSWHPKPTTTAGGGASAQPGTPGATTTTATGTPGATTVTATADQQAASLAAQNAVSQLELAKQIYENIQLPEAQQQMKLNMLDYQLRKSMNDEQIKYYDALVQNFDRQYNVQLRQLSDQEYKDMVTLSQNQSIATGYFGQPVDTQGLYDFLQKNNAQGGYGPGNPTPRDKWTSWLQAYGVSPDQARQVADAEYAFVQANGRGPSEQEFDGILKSLNVGMTPTLDNRIQTGYLDLARQMQPAQLASSQAQNLNAQLLQRAQSVASAQLAQQQAQEQRSQTLAQLYANPRDWLSSSYYNLMAPQYTKGSDLYPGLQGQQSVDKLFPTADAIKAQYPTIPSLIPSSNGAATGASQPAATTPLNDTLTTPHAAGMKLPQDQGMPS